MKHEFIKIQDSRYRLQNIKRYEPYKSDSKFGIYIYFSTTNTMDRKYHVFSIKKERDEMLLKLDETFNVKY